MREAGILDSFNLSPDDAETLIMRARVAMGWIEPPEETPEEEFAEAEGFEGVEGEEADERLGDVPDPAKVFGDEMERTRDA